MRYEGQIYRPPSEADAYILQATVGCSWNACVYCDMYREKRFRVRALDETLTDVRLAGAQLGHAARKLFVADGDALVLPVDHWLALLGAIGRDFPRLERVSCYAMASNVLDKSVEELTALRRAGLKRLYIGPESGDDVTLKRIAKGSTFDEHVRAAERAHAAGLEISVIVMLGVAGTVRSEEHATQTAALLTQMDPEYAAALTTTVVPGTPLETLVKRARFELPSMEQMFGELRTIVDLARPRRCVFRSNHASNYLPLAGELPRDRERIVRTIDAALAGRVTLRPESQRGLRALGPWRVMAAELILVLALLAAGYLARRLKRFPESASDVLNRFVIDLCVPAVVLRLVPSLHFQASLLVLVATPWILAALAYLIARVAARALRLDRATEAVLFLCTALGNTSFLAFPLCVALLGESSLPYAAVYDQLGTFLLLSIVAPLVLSRAVGGPVPSALATVKRVLTFPPFVALIVALLPWPRPAVLDDVLKLVSAALVPVGLFAVGLRLRIRPPRELSALVLGLLVKLGLFPLVAMGLGTLFQPTRAVLDVVVLEAAMPASVTAGAIAMAAGLAPELAAALVGWGVVIALVSVPAWAALLH